MGDPVKGVEAIRSLLLNLENVNDDFTNAGWEEACERIDRCFADFQEKYGLDQDRIETLKVTLKSHLMSDEFLEDFSILNAIGVCFSSDNMDIPSDASLNDFFESNFGEQLDNLVSQSVYRVIMSIASGPEADFEASHSISIAQPSDENTTLPELNAPERALENFIKQITTDINDDISATDVSSTVREMRYQFQLGKRFEKRFLFALDTLDTHLTGSDESLSMRDVLLCLKKCAPDIKGHGLVSDTASEAANKLLAHLDAAEGTAHDLRDNNPGLTNPVGNVLQGFRSQK